MHKSTTEAMVLLSGPAVGYAMHLTADISLNSVVSRGLNHYEQL